MIRNFLTLSLIFMTASLFAQTELEKRNGFKDIKLGMIADSIKGLKFKKDFKEVDEFDAKLYQVENENYAKIGEVDVERVEIKTYKNKIYQIHVVTEKDPRLMKALESIYGKSDYDLKKGTYFWRAETMSLKFRSYSKDKLELIYTSFTMFNMMKEDKGKKVQDIADDF